MRFVFLLFTCRGDYTGRSMNYLTSRSPLSEPDVSGVTRSYSDDGEITQRRRENLYSRSPLYAQQCRIQCST